MNLIHFIVHLYDSFTWGIPYLTWLVSVTHLIIDYRFLDQWWRSTVTVETYQSSKNFLIYLTNLIRDSEKGHDIKLKFFIWGPVYVTEYRIFRSWNPPTPPS